MPDVGPGIHTVVQQIVSEVLDLPRERVKVVVIDTDNSPFDSGTGGSKSTNSVGTAAYQAVTEIKEKLLSLVAAKFGCKSEAIEESKGRYNVPGQKPMSCTDMMCHAVGQNGGALTHLSIYEPARAPITSFAVQVAEVIVDPGTGQVKVTKLTTVHDSGTVLNHLSYTGQIDGGIVTGLGFALMEDNSLVDGKMADDQSRRVQDGQHRRPAETDHGIDGKPRWPDPLSWQSHSGNSQCADRSGHRQRRAGRLRRAHRWICR